MHIRKNGCPFMKLAMVVGVGYLMWKIFKRKPYYSFSEDSFADTRTGF